MTNAQFAEQMNVKITESGLVGLITKISKNGWIEVTRYEQDEEITTKHRPAELEKLKIQNMSSTLARYRVGYKDAVNASGKKTKICGDELSQAFLSLDPEQTMAKAEQFLNLEPGFLKEKYAKLNPGQKKMNSTNRVRAALKRGDITIEQITA